MNCVLREMAPDEFKSIFKRIRQDFAPGEYAPYGILYEQLCDGTQTGMVLSRDGVDSGYAICAAGSPNGYVLLSYMAVFSEFRGQGLGLVLLEEIKKRYSIKQGIIAEVEKPENATTEQERETCEKRISFYLKAGYRVVPGIDYTIWDVSMHLMALPCAASFKTISAGIDEIIRGIYLEIMGERFMHKLELRAL